MCYIFFVLCYVFDRFGPNSAHEVTENPLVVFTSFVETAEATAALYLNTVKVKVTLEEDTKAQKGSRGIALLLL